MYFRLNRGVVWVYCVLVGLFLALVVGAVFRPWLGPFLQPQRGGPELPFRAGDLTPLFSIWTQITSRSLFEQGEWPFWSDHIYCGEPFYAKPQIGVLSLTTLLCAALPPQVVATWTFLLHLWIAGLAMFAWCLDVLRGVARPAGRFCENPDAALRSTSTTSLALQASITRHDGHGAVAVLAAACGAVAFMLSGLMVEHTLIGHGPIVLVACWTPLVLRSLGRALIGPHTARECTKAGVLLAVQLLAGGETVFLYNLIAGGLLGLAWLFFGPQAGCGESTTQNSDCCGGQPSQGTNRARRLLRLLFVAAFIGLIGFTLSAVKVLPGLQLMPITNRAGGLSLADASGVIEEFREPALLRAIDRGGRELSDWHTLLPITLALGLAGLAAARSPGLPRMVVCTAVLMIVAGIALAHSQGVFALLWHVLPVFRYQRIPQRALVLGYLGLSMLVALGVQGLLSRKRLAEASGSAGVVRTWPLVAGLALLLGLTFESWFALSALPPVADIRREVRENHILNYLASQPGEFRIHAIESTDRNWGIEHVTVPLGLKNLAGWDHLWLLEYLGAEGTVGRDVLPFLTASYQARHPARFWGLMSVRFVTSTRPISVAGLRFVQEFPRSPTSQPAKSAGPYLYENVSFQPRVRVVPNAILVLGGREERIEATYRLIDHVRFDPSRAVLLYPAGVADGLGPGMRPGGDSVARSPAPASDGGLPYGCRSVVLPGTSRSGEAADGSRVFYSAAAGSSTFWLSADAVETMLGEACDPAVDLADALPVVESISGNSWRIRLSGQKGYLVIADKLAHFPGWVARSAAGPRELLKANGVATVIALDGTEQWIELHYWPPGLSAGLAWLAVGLMLVAGVIAWEWRMAVRARRGN